MDEIEHNVRMYLAFVRQLRDDVVEQDILEYITELLEKGKGMRLRKEKVNKGPAKEVFDHFLALYNKKYGKPYEVVSNRIGVYTRISNFMKTHKLSVDEYITFLDYCFVNFYSNKFVPGIGHVCSADMLAMVKNAKTKKKKPDFRKLREELRGKEMR